MPVLINEMNLETDTADTDEALDSASEEQKKDPENKPFTSVKLIMMICQEREFRIRAH